MPARFVVTSKLYTRRMRANQLFHTKQNYRLRPAFEVHTGTDRRNVLYVRYLAEQLLENSLIHSDSTGTVGWECRQTGRSVGCVWSVPPRHVPRPNLELWHETLHILSTTE